MSAWERIKITAYRDLSNARRWRVVDTRHGKTIYDGPDEVRANEIRDQAVREVQAIEAYNQKAVQP